MLKAILAGLIILVILLGWILVQQVARRFARNHPEWGPYNERAGCGGNCTCASGGSCKKR